MSNLLMPLPFFVYGTLRPGGSHHDACFSHQIVSVRTATLTGRLFVHHEGDYPFLVHGRDTVIGEVIEVAQERWKTVAERLDLLEEYDPDNEEDSLYLRRRMLAVLETGLTVEVWAYLWNRAESEGEFLPGGDWHKR